MGTSKTQWVQHASLVADPDCDQAHFQATIELWLHGFMTETILQDIVKQLHQLYKPRDMSVQNFVSCFEELNSLLKYCPNINTINPVPLADANKCIILKKACSGAWKDKMTKANLNFINFRDLTMHYTGLKSVETSTTRKHNNNYSSNNNSSNNSGNNRTRYCNNNNQCNTCNSNNNNRNYNRNNDKNSA
eukprot:11246919-Ditylum_brightwellii.AAC.1